MHKSELKKLKLTSLSEVQSPAEMRRNVNILLCGVVKDIRKMKSKKGNWFNILLLDDGKSIAEVLLFDDALPVDDILKEDDVIVLEALLGWDKFRKKRRLKVTLIQNIEKYRGYNLKKICLNLKCPQDSHKLSNLKDLLEKTESGESSLYFNYEYQGLKAKLIPVNDRGNKNTNKIGLSGIKVTDQLLEDIKSLLGEKNIELSY